MATWRAGEAGVGLDDFAERYAVQQLHGDVGPALDLADIVDRDDVRMGQATCSLRFAQEPAALFLFDAQILMQEFDCERAVDAGIVGLVDRRHRTLADPLQDLIAPRLLESGAVPVPSIGVWLRAARERIAESGPDTSLVRINWSCVLGVARCCRWRAEVAGRVVRLRHDFSPEADSIRSRAVAPRFILRVSCLDADSDGTRMSNCRHSSCKSNPVASSPSVPSRRRAARRNSQVLANRQTQADTA